MPEETEITAEELIAQQEEAKKAAQMIIAREAAEDSARDRNVDLLAVQIEDARTPEEVATILRLQDPGQYGGWAALMRGLSPILGYFFSFVNGDNSHNDAFALAEIRRGRYLPTAESIAAKGGIDGAKAREPFKTAAADIDSANETHAPTASFEPETPAA